MKQVALLDKENELIVSQPNQQQPPTPKLPARPQPEPKNLTFMDPVKPRAQQHQTPVNLSNPPKHSRPSFPPEIPFGQGVDNVPNDDKIVEESAPPPELKHTCGISMAAEAQTEQNKSLAVETGPVAEDVLVQKPAKKFSEAEWMR